MLQKILTGLCTKKDINRIVNKHIKAVDNSCNEQEYMERKISLISKRKTFGMRRLKRIYYNIYINILFIIYIYIYNRGFN